MLILTILAFFSLGLIHILPLSRTYLQKERGPSSLKGPEDICQEVPQFFQTDHSAKLIDYPAYEVWVRSGLKGERKELIKLIKDNPRDLTVMKAFVDSFLEGGAPKNNGPTLVAELLVRAFDYSSGHQALGLFWLERIFWGPAGKLNWEKMLELFPEFGLLSRRALIAKIRRTLSVHMAFQYYQQRIHINGWSKFVDRFLSIDPQAVAEKMPPKMLQKLMVPVSWWDRVTNLQVPEDRLLAMIRAEFSENSVQNFRNEMMKLNGQRMAPKLFADELKYHLITHALPALFLLFEAYYINEIFLMSAQIEEGEKIKEELREQSQSAIDQFLNLDAESTGLQYEACLKRKVKNTEWLKRWCKERYLNP